MRMQLWKHNEEPTKELAMTATPTAAEAIKSITDHLAKERANVLDLAASNPADAKIMTGIADRLTAELDRRAANPTTLTTRELCRLHTRHHYAVETALSGPRYDGYDPTAAFSALRGLTEADEGWIVATAVADDYTVIGYCPGATLELEKLDAFAALDEDTTD